jgi:hypothetical protein
MIVQRNKVCHLAIAWGFYSRRQALHWDTSEKESQSPAVGRLNIPSYLATAQRSASWKGIEEKQP